jgi:hypothetical protein
MAYTTIKKPSDYFNTKLYTGDGAASKSITGVNFEPNFVWIKGRSSADNHNLFDNVRGVQKVLRSNLSDAEVTYSNSLLSFDSDGFTVGTHTPINRNGGTIASWNWKANGTGVANTDGSISSTVSANTTSGFSIVSYTGTGANATVGHGLSSAPKMIFFKRIDADDAWWSYNETIGAGGEIILNSNNAAGSNGGVLWNSTAPTSSVFNVGTNGGVNGSGGTYVAYAFADVQGFSKIGSYIGNSSTNGTFVYLGFKPAWVLLKNASVAQSWTMLDTKRDINPNAKVLWPNDNFAEYDETEGVDFLSNGFKIRESATGFNGSGNSIIYMAFAEEPLVGDNPATAR